MPVIYLIQTAIFVLFFPKPWWILLYALSLPVFGYWAKMISLWAGTTAEKWRVLRNKKIFAKKVLSLRLEILTLLNN
jgi:hypothetical protein